MRVETPFRRMPRMPVLEWVLAAVLIFGPVAARAAADPIRVGATVSLSGKYAEVSEMVRNGYRLWEKQVNERGGLLDRPVQLLLRDDASRPDRAAALYGELIAQEGVDLVLSPYSTPLTLAASEVTERNGTVMLASAASGETIWERGRRYVFGVYAVAGRYFIGFLDLMARNGMRSLSLLYEDSDFNLAVAEGVRRWAGRFGIDVSYDRAFQQADADLPVWVLGARQSGADGLILSAYPETGYRFLDLLREKNYRPRALAMTIAPVLPNFPQRAGDMAEGVFGPSQWEPDERIPFPGTQQFIEDFRAFTGRSPAYHAGSAYAACQILERAVEQTRSLDHARLRDFISSLDTVTVIGRFKVDHTGKQVGHNPILIQWQGGKKEIVYPLHMRTAEPRFDRSTP